MHLFHFQITLLNSSTKSKILCECPSLITILTDVKRIRAFLTSNVQRMWHIWNRGASFEDRLLKDIANFVFDWVTAQLSQNINICSQGNLSHTHVPNYAAKSSSEELLWKHILSEYFNKLTVIGLFPVLF